MVRAVSRSRGILKALGPTLLIAVAIGVGWAIGSQSEHEMHGDHQMDKPAVARDDATVERSFLQAMVPHHESGIEMAEIALDHSEAPEITKLSQAIRETQGVEIEQMQRIHQRLFDASLEPDEGAHAALGLSMHEAGMGHDEAMMKELASSKPFERAFVDMMVPHHQGAVEMSEVLLERTDDAELKKLGQAIIDAQKREIAAMNDFRTEKYGGPVPPQKQGEHGGMDGMEMDGE
jgi:uncharacterized protein (DUF305 family)